MFIQLAKDEYDHMDILENSKKEYTEGAPFEMPELPTERIKELEEILAKPERKEHALKDKGDLSDLDALKMALDFEKRASEYYSELAEKAPDDRTKELARSLSEWEASHYDLIQAEIDSISNTGFFFGTKYFEMSERF